ncbi:MAG: FecR domain-containing protein [Gammaproteobacteria bacterium]
MSVIRKRFIRRTLCAIGLLAGASAYSQEWIYSVRPGDNLWKLSKNYLKQLDRWSDLQAHNKIEDPQHIPPGTPIRIPIAWLKHQPVPARVVAARGTVELVASLGRPPLPLAAGAELHVGNRIQTSSNSSATLQFADRSLLLIQADTSLVLDTLSAFGKTGMVDTRMRLQRGRGESQVAPATGPSSRYQITTPAAVAAVRGTRFRVAAVAIAGTTRAEVIKGRVEFEGAGVRRLVAAGFGVVAEIGKPPSEPLKLLSPPDLSRLPFGVKRLPLTFQWLPVDAARAYRAQVFADATFRRLLLEQRVKSPRVQWAALLDGHYVLRVRAIDGMGLEGLNADHHFTLDTGPKAPLLLEPRDGATLRTSRPQFRWQAPSSATRVRLQVARDPAFNDIVFEVRDYDAAVSLQPQKPLLPGVYYWRIASQRVNADDGPFGAPRRFRLQALLAQSRVWPPSIENRRVRVTWQATPHAVRYRCQFAQSAEFTQIIAEQVVKEPRCRIDPLSQGTYYFRVQGFSAEGIAGPFSNVVPFEVTPPAYLPFFLLGLLLLLLLLL